MLIIEGVIAGKSYSSIGSVSSFHWFVYTSYISIIIMVVQSVGDQVSNMSGCDIGAVSKTVIKNLYRSRKRGSSSVCGGDSIGGSISSGGEVVHGCLLYTSPSPRDRG